MILDWAEKRWKDPLTGTDVVRLSPGKKSHFRNTYFRRPMFTRDGQWCVIVEHSRLRDGEGYGDKRIWARNMVDGELRDLGPLPPSTNELSYSVAPRSHLVNILDMPKTGQNAVIQIDIDSGRVRRIEPANDKFPISDCGFSADERFVYSPWFKEKNSLRDTMSYVDWVAMMSGKPGYQEMIRMHLESGELETVFDTSSWWMGHSIPHPDDPGLFMCCQTVVGNNDKWGFPAEYQRIRIFNLSTKKWLTHS